MIESQEIQGYFEASDENFRTSVKVLDVEDTLEGGGGGAPTLPRLRTVPARHDCLAAGVWLEFL